MNYTSQGSAVKQRILDIAAKLFAEKGFTETSTRELSKAAGFKNPSSIYHHFPSKGAILEHMLEDYSAVNIDVFKSKDVFSILREEPNADGIMKCFQTSFPTERADYYMKVLCVLLHEQLRNPLVRDYVSRQIVLRSQLNTGEIIDTLKKLGVIRPDVDSDYWIKVSSSLMYSYAARMMMGIGDNAPDYTGMGMVELLKYTFEMMLERCGSSNAPKADG